MIKNDFNDNVVSEFLMLVPKLEDLNLENFLDKLPELYKKYTGLNYSLTESLPFKELTTLLKPANIQDYTRLLVVASLIFVEGEKKDEYPKLLKSFNIFSSSIEDGLDLNDSKFKELFLDLLDSLREYTLPLDLSLDIFNHYKTLNAFDKGEDCLYEIVEDNPSKKNILIDYYTYLLTLEENILTKGGLSKDEVLNSLEDIRK